MVSPLWKILNSFSWALDGLLCSKNWCLLEGEILVNDLFIMNIVLNKTPNSFGKGGKKGVRNLGISLVPMAEMEAGWLISLIVMFDPYKIFVGLFLN